MAIEPRPRVLFLAGPLNGVIFVKRPVINAETPPESGQERFLIVEIPGERAPDRCNSHFSPVLPTKNTVDLVADPDLRRFLR